MNLNNLLKKVGSIHRLKGFSYNVFIKRNEVDHTGKVGVAFEQLEDLPNFLFAQSIDVVDHYDYLPVLFEEEIVNFLLYSLGVLFEEIGHPFERRRAALCQGSGSLASCRRLG